MVKNLLQLRKIQHLSSHATNYVKISRRLLHFLNSISTKSLFKKNHCLTRGETSNCIPNALSLLLCNSFRQSKQKAQLKLSQIIQETCHHPSPPWKRKRRKKNKCMRVCVCQKKKDTRKRRKRTFEGGICKKIITRQIYCSHLLANWLIYFDHDIVSYSCSV